MNYEDLMIWFALMTLALGVMISEAMYFLSKYLKEKRKNEQSISMSVIQQQAHQWHYDTFGPSKNPMTNGIINKAIEECHELIKALEDWKESNQWTDTERLRGEAMEEFADIFIVMSVWASRKGDSLEEAILHKMIKNKLRQWGPVDENGISRHTKEG